MAFGITDWFVKSIKTGEIISYVFSGIVGEHSHLKARLLAYKMNKIAGGKVFVEDFRCH